MSLHFDDRKLTTRAQVRLGHEAEPAAVSKVILYMHHRDTSAGNWPGWDVPQPALTTCSPWIQDSQCLLKALGGSLSLFCGVKSK